MKKRKILIVLLLIILLIVSFPFLRPKYKVTFILDNEETIKYVNKNEMVEEKSVPKKEGYTFIGWYNDEEKFDFQTKITKSIKLIAKYKKQEDSEITLCFDTLGGEKIKEITLIKGSNLQDIPKPIKDGYYFMGWYYQNKLVDFSRPIDKNMTFVAKWKKDTTKKYTVSFDSDNNTLIEEKIVREGEMVEAPVVPIKKGYKFLGWYLEDKLYDFTNPINKNIILVAKWEKE